MSNIEHIGDLKSEDVYGNVVLASMNSEKAEVLGKFFESVFVIENDSVPHNLQPRPCQSLFRDPIFSEQIILEKLNSLKYQNLQVPITFIHRYCTSYAVK